MKTVKPKSYRKKNYKKSYKKKYSESKKQKQDHAAISALKNYFDLNVDTTLDTNANVISCMNIVQGFANNTRLGDTVSLTSYYIRLALTLADTINYVRCWLILDTSSDGALPVRDDLFTGITTTPMLWAMNDRNKHRFKVLRDITVKLDADDPIKLLTIKGSFKRPIRSTFLDNSGTASAFGQNHLYMVFASDSIAAAHPPLKGLIRTYFFP